MANIKSSIKRISITEKKTLRNKIVKSSLKTRIKKYNLAVSSGELDAARDMYPLVSKAIDKAAAKGIIHKNSANRKKARLAAKLN